MKNPLFWIAGVAFGLMSVALADPVISEFMASNQTGQEDEDGQRNDWIEIHNPDNAPVNLAGWHLTDKATNLAKWTFPAVTIPAKGFLLVWASEKDRTDPTKPLHTNFKLADDGEYLALTRPNSSVAHEFAPSYPVQAPDVSYGIPVSEVSTTLTGPGQGAKVLVPTDGALGTTWNARGFNDSAWTARTLGVGFDSPTPPTPATAQWADSVAEFSGVQGQNGWSYGYWNRTADVDKVYQTTDLTLFLNDGTNVISATNAWTGAFWDLNGTGAPWTEITNGGGHPNGSNSGPEHWTVRRYVSEFTGRARFVGTLGDGAECGDGVAVRIFVDGVQVYYKPTFSSVPLEFSAEADVETGQKIDFVIDPIGNDSCDGHAFNVKVYSGTLADSVADWTAGGLATSRNWRYGYYRKSGDGDGVYQAANFTAFPRTAGSTTVGAANAWNGTNWQLSTTTPVTALTATGGTPAVTGATDWPVRRWVSTYAGRIQINGTIGHISAGADGVTGRIFVNDTSIFGKSVNNASEGYTVFADVAVGSTVDFLIDPNATETADAGATFTAAITPAAVGASVVADSIANYGSGAQGTNGWNHGYYNKTDDSDGTYAATDFNFTDANWTLGGGTWALGPGDPPWTNVGTSTGHPNGTNSGGKEHWAIRRWTSTVNGPVTVNWNLSKIASGGAGTTVKILHNGTEKGSGAILGTDRVGLARSTTIESVAIGDKIDIALTPVGATGDTADGADGSFFSARIVHSSLSANVTLAKVADSVADWSTSGTQGFKGWSYGYYNKTADGDGVYQAANFNAFLRDGSNTISGTNQWNGSQWDLNPAASGPWTELGQTTTHPNGTNSGNEHWPIRRWTTTVAGPLSVTWKVWKTNPSGGGVSIRCFHNNTQMDTGAIAGADTTGITRTFTIPAAAVGDTIDVALTPVGLAGGTDDGADGSAFTAVISSVTSFANYIDAGAGSIGPQMAGINPTAYVRAPLATPAGTFDKLKLKMTYDDGFVAYLNGVEVARRNAPETAAGGFFADSTAEFSGVQGQGNWFYGYWNKSTDANGSYEPSDLNTADPVWGYNGNWYMNPGNPPWTSLFNAGGHPNGPNSGNVHDVTRRWVSEAAGTVMAHVHLAKSNGGCGSGSTGTLYHNGKIVWRQAVAGTDTVGVWADVSVPGVQIGDFLDLSIGSIGIDGGTDDACDSTILTMTVDQLPSEGLTWRSTATAARPSSEAATPLEIDLTTQRFLLASGALDNVLAIHGMNVRVSDSDFLVSPELIGLTVTADPNGRNYFTTPTPAAVNSAGSTTVGPVIANVTDSPVVADADDIVITAKVSPVLAPVGGVTLTYRVMYGPEASIPMFDDGAHGDALAGDGVYGASLAAALSTPGQMVRWRITATDSASRQTKSPPYNDPLNSPEYWGTVVSVTNPVAGGQLPVLHWFTNNAAAHDGSGGGRCAIFYNGQFLDNVSADLHGQSSTGFPKKSYDFHLNTGHKLEWDSTPNNSTPKVNSFNLLSTYPDKAYLRNVVSYGIFRQAGVPAHFAFPVQVRRNNAFFSVAHIVEDGDEDYLQRAPGLDADGALYKMYNIFDNPNSPGAEKKSRRYEGNSDLAAFMAGLSQTGVTKERFIYDNAGLPETINYLAAGIMTGNDDCCHKNYYVFRDSDGNGEWRPLPWDVDLSLGRVWRSDLTYFRDAMEPATSIYVGSGNRFMTPFLDNSIPALKQMFLRRLRTLADTILNQTATPLVDRYLENQLAFWQPLIQPDADYERGLALWGTWGTPQTMAQAVDIIRNDYLPPRRNYIFSHADLPPAQNPSVVVNFGTVEYDPANHNQDQEFFTLVNPNAVAVDVSNWKISGAVKHTLKPGTVIPAGGTLHLSPNVNAFRARTTSPKASESRFVQGNYDGQLSARGETLTLMDGARTVATLSYNGTPSDAQNFLRVTEMMYSPGAKAGDTFATSDYEFLELRNISGATSIDLTGVKFTNGIDFAFTGGTLAAGQRAILVKNPAAFAERHPGVTVAGTYTGSLDNAGERITLLDSRNEEILDYTYEGDWYPATNGGGFSLVVADEAQAPDLWTLKIGWKPSGTIFGTPGAADAVADTDHDGLPDYAEWLAGTDPLAPQSVFAIVPAVGGPASEFRGQFDGIAGKSYTVQYSDALGTPAWQKLQDFTVNADGPIVFSDPGLPVNGRRFYRVVTPAQP